jgi:hypothetical protein
VIGKKKWTIDIALGWAGRDIECFMFGCRSLNPKDEVKNRELDRLLEMLGLLT